MAQLSKKHDEIISKKAIIGYFCVVLVALFLISCSGSDKDFSRPATEAELIEAEKLEALAKATLPLEAAMRIFAARGRAAHLAIEPAPSEDTSSLDGWSYGSGSGPVAGAEATMPGECENDANPMACWGRKLRNTKGCVACHAIDGQKQQPGPNWKDLFGTQRLLASGESVAVDGEYIRRSILDPWSELVEGYGRAMPPQNLQDQEIEAVIAYLKSLGGGK